MRGFEVCYPAAADGAVLELTGVAPQIGFGSADSPTCTISLNTPERRLESTCAISVPDTGRRRLANEAAFASEMESLRAEIAELRNDVNKLAAQGSVNVD